MRYFILLTIIFLCKSLFAQDTIHPQFVGGDVALYQFLANHIKYPEYALEEGISGKVLTEFVIEKDGSVSNIKVTNGIGGGCDEEAIRVIKLMQGLWKPGLENGEPVRVLYHLPIKFTIAGVIPISTINEYYDIGIQLMNEGEYIKAINYLSYYKTGNNVHVGSLYSLGLCYLTLKNFNDAIMCFQEGMKYDCPNCMSKLAESYQELGNVYLVKKRYKKAIAYFNNSLEFASTNTKVLINRGKSHYFLKNRIDACRDWEKAKELGDTKAQTLLEEYCKD